MAQFEAWVMWAHIDFLIHNLEEFQFGRGLHEALRDRTRGYPEPVLVPISEQSVLLNHRGSVAKQEFVPVPEHQRITTSFSKTWEYRLSNRK